LQDPDRIRIHASEFIHSWEKKWRELTKLDFFIYQAINLLIAKMLELFPHEQLAARNSIRTLGFLIGDRLEAFLSENCFHECPLQCPISQDQLIINPPDLGRQGELKQISRMIKNMRQPRAKAKIWQRDLRRFVIAETVFEFLRFGENDLFYNSGKDLRDLISALTRVIFHFTQTKEGRSLLEQRIDLAGFEFLGALKAEDNERFGHLDHRNPDQLDMFLEDNLDDEDEEEIEEWQYPVLNLDELLAAHLLDLRYWRRFPGNEFLRRKQEHLEILNSFLADYSWFSQISDVDVGSMNEFFHFFLPFYFDLDEYGKIAEIYDSVVHFFSWLRLRNYDISPAVSKSLRQKQRFIQRMTSLRHFFRSVNDIPELVERANNFVFYQDYFQVHGRSPNALVVYTSNSPLPVKIRIPKDAGTFFRKDDILDCIVAKKGKRDFFIWHLRHVYPGQAQLYLFGDAETDENGE
jgi:hypothetical protein